MRSGLTEEGRQPPIRTAIERVSAMVEAELEGDAVYEVLFTVPGVGPKTAARKRLKVIYAVMRDARPYVA